MYHVNTTVNKYGTMVHIKSTMLPPEYWIDECPHHKIYCTVYTNKNDQPVSKSCVLFATSWVGSVTGIMSSIYVRETEDI